MTVITSNEHAILDEAVADLGAHADEWVALPLDEKIALLDGLKKRTMDEAEAMVAATQAAKGVDPDTTWGAEDWITGPWAFLQGVTALLNTLKRVQAGKPPVGAKQVHTRANGQTVVDVFPATASDGLLLNGYKAAVWMQPGVTPAQAAADAASMYRGQGYEQPGVTLILGAGNVGSITSLDILHALYTEGSVAIVKMNPVNDYLAPFFDRIFAEYVTRGWLRFVNGGADVGGYLAHHEGIDAVHMTGSIATHDAIVWGAGDEAADNKRAGTPLLSKKMTSELGGVSPMIVTPGEWSDADLEFQAEHIVSSKLNNAGHNCIATQVIVISEDWPQADALLDRVRAIIRGLPPRDSYYPRAGEKIQAAVAGHDSAEPLGPDDLCTVVPDLSASGAQSLLNDEVFAGAMGIVRLPGKTAEDFLPGAVAFANDELPGTLGATILVDPATAKKYAKAVDIAISDMRYGCLGVNVWSGFGFLLGYTPWGAFPGHTLDAVGSGIGVVHNAFLLQDVQKAVVSMPFRPMHRAALKGQFHMSPKSPFFVTNKTAQTTVRRLCNFLADPSPTGLPGIFAAALRG